MLKHENPHIEIINKNLWAVRFSLIPFIPQIDYRPDPDIPAYSEPVRITGDGVAILNKDYKGYPGIRKVWPALMKLKPKQLHRELDMLSTMPISNANQIIYQFCLTGELERRKKERGVT